MPAEYLATAPSEAMTWPRGDMSYSEKMKKDAEGNNIYARQVIDYALKQFDDASPLAAPVAGTADAGYNLLTMTRSQRMTYLYNIFNGKFDRNRFKYLTTTYGLDSYTYPATFDNFPIIRPKHDLLLSEWQQRPFNYRVVSTNKRAVSKRLKLKTDLMIEKVMQREVMKLKQMGIDLTTGIPLPEDIDEFVRLKYKEPVEITMQRAVTRCVEINNLLEQFSKNLSDVIITAECFSKVCILNGHPYVEWYDPRDVVYKEGNSPYLDDTPYFFVRKEMYLYDILNQYGHLLTRKQKNRLYEIEGEAHLNTGSMSAYNRNFNYYNYNQQTGELRISVIEGEWHSERNLRQRISPNKNDPNNPFYKILQDEDIINEEDIERKKYELNEKIIDDIWQATLIGHEFVIGAGPRPNQIRLETEKYGKSYLSYTGYLHNRINGYSVSITELLDEIQIFHNILQYQIKLNVARAKGKVIDYDTAYTPVKWTPEKVMHHIAADGIRFYNSKQEGLDGKPALGEGDLSISQTVGQLINIDLMILDMADRVTGISEFRQGKIPASTSPTVARQSIGQSSLITESMFWGFSQYIKRVLFRVAGMAKFAYREGFQGSYVTGDLGVETLNITKDVSLYDWDVYISDGQKEQMIQNMILQLSQGSLNKGEFNTLDMLNVITADTVQEARAALEAGINKMKKIQEQQMQQAVQGKQMELQQESMKTAAELQTKVKVAEIQGQAKIQSTQILTEHEKEIKEGQALDQHAITEKKLMTDMEKKRMSEFNKMTEKK